MGLRAANATTGRMKPFGVAKAATGHTRVPDYLERTKPSKDLMAAVICKGWALFAKIGEIYAYKVAA